ncbi:putative Glycosyltransferase [Azospirillaceae bacterium]
MEINDNVVPLVKRIIKLIDPNTHSNIDVTNSSTFLNEIDDVCRYAAELILEDRQELVDAVFLSPHPADIILKNSILFMISRDPFFYRQMIHPLINQIKNISISFIHYVYWCISRELFIRPVNSPDANAFISRDLFRYYRVMICEISRRLEILPKSTHKPRPSTPRRLALITDQFLGPRHQPSRDIFECAVKLQEIFEVEVTVFNVNLRPLDSCALFYPPMIANIETTFSGAQWIEMNGRSVRFISFVDRAFSIEKIAHVVSILNAFDPDVVIGFGDSNIIADLFAEKRPVICLPTTSSLPFSLGDIVLVWDSAWKNTDLTTCSRLSRSVLRPFLYALFFPPRNETWSRDTFLLTDEDFIMSIVSNRLDEEIDGPFLECIDRLLTACPRLHILLAGHAEQLPSRLANQPNRQRLHIIGYVEDVRALYQMSDGALNPFRSGGGASVALALAEGRPVVSLATGDGSAVIGPDLTVPDVERYIARVSAMATNPDLRKTLGAVALQRFLQRCDWSESMKQLFGYCCEAMTLP